MTIGHGNADWISVKELLPEENERVLLYSAADDEVVIGILSQAPARFVKGPEPFYGVWIREAEQPDDDGGHRYFNPSHWMPLPSGALIDTGDRK